MAFYASFLHLIYDLKVEQHLFYLSEGKPKHITGLVKWDNFLCQYKIHCISDCSYREFINSDVPEEVVLSILANPDGNTGEKIIHLILNRLVQLRGNSTELGKFVNQVKVLSMLRKLRDVTIKQINQRSFIIPNDLIEADGYFIKGKEPGREEGREEGIEQGTEKQVVVASVNMLAHRRHSRRGA